MDVSFESYSVRLNVRGGTIGPDTLGTVDLTLTRRGDYVVRAAIALAEAWDGDGRYLKMREIAENMSLPLGYTPQLLAILAEAGLTEARAGPSGGHRLRRPPDTITVLEVVEAAEGPLSSRRCAIRGGPCRWDDVCALHPTVVKAAEAIRATLAATTLAEVASVDRTLGAAELVPRRRSPGGAARAPDGVRGAQEASAISADVSPPGRGDVRPSRRPAPSGTKG